MDLDEEGRTVLGFWGLEEGSGTVDGEKKMRKRMKEEDGEQEIESKILELLFS